MQEVIIKLRFNRECLGAAKRKRHSQVVFSFDHDPAGRVMFMPSAWSSVMRYAAKLSNRHHDAVQKIDWCPLVEGQPRPDWRRTIVSKAGDTTKTHYAVHEAFPPGATILISAVVPDEISLKEFEDLLTIVGKYKGFSPFNNATEHYGTFEVLSITTIRDNANVV